MFRRQRMLISLVDQSGGQVSRLVLVKMAFLLAQEPEVLEAGAFYDFVPYKFGPFSFGLYRDLANLEARGHLTTTDRSVMLASGAPGSAGRSAAELPGGGGDAIGRIVARYRPMRTDALLGYVYRRFPWYATASERRELVPADLPERAVAPVAAYTVGYEGKSVDAFFDALLRAGIQAVIDVRSNPVSRKYGFARKSMGRNSRGAPS